MKLKEGGREQDSGESERERECVCERQSMAQRGVSIDCKMGHWRNVTSKIRIGL
jgi:hypothetical protein